MNSELIFLFNISDFDTIPEKIIKNSKNKIFSFDLDVHKKLNSNKINHNLADTILDKDERIKIFEKSLEFLPWYSKIPSKDLEFEGVNLLSIFDGHEFRSFLIHILINFITIKKIIKEENPAKIICSSLISNIVKPLIKNSDIELTIFQNENTNNLFWDTISINYNFGKIPISLNLSKKNFLKIKKYAESFVGFFSNFWLDLNKSQKSLILLEFNTELFSTLLFYLKNYDGNIILVNQRRSALWSKRAIEAVKKSNCKILNYEKILTNDEKSEIQILVREYSKKFDNFWKNSTFFDEFFQIENLTFWDAIKDSIIKNYNKKLYNSIFLIRMAKIIFTKMDVRGIVSLNEIGETERTFLEFNKKNIPSILLEHGFIERDDKTKYFDRLDYTNFKDKLAVWGNVKKNYLMKNYPIDSSKIFVSGSPRHDDYFNSRIEKKCSKEITVLLAPNPITEIHGFANTNLELKFEKLISEIILILKHFKNIKLIIKLHATQLKHNIKIKNMIQQIDSTIPIHQSTPVIETINKSDIVIVISPESFGTSTMLAESMILRKPTMNIIIDDELPKFDHITQNAVFTVSYNQNLENYIKQMLFDEKFKKEITNNADVFIDNFFEFQGNSSENFAKFLKSL